MIELFMLITAVVSNSKNKSNLEIPGSFSKGPIFKCSTYCPAELCPSADEYVLEYVKTCALSESERIRLRHSLLFFKIARYDSKSLHSNTL